MSKKMIADIYPLSPMQEGMLYHYLSGASPEQYVEQTCLTVQGDLNQERFEAAWNRVIERQDLLRTVFRWEDVERPLQIVLHKRSLRLKVLDLQQTDDPQKSLEEVKMMDWREGFDLARGPLHRVTLCRLADDIHAMIWSFHHIILDGWSTGIIWRELFQTYMNCDHDAIPGTAVAPFQYREYIRFLETLNVESISQYWHHYLQGFTAPTSLPGDRMTHIEQMRQVSLCTCSLSNDLTRQMKELAKEHRVTVSLIVQAAWGILLQKYVCTDDVLFGIAVSGRPPHLPGIQDGVGLFINAIPVRVKTTVQSTVAELLRHLGTESFQRSRNEYLALTEIKAQSELKGQNPLFDQLIVYENYPIDESLNGINLGLTLLDVSTHEMTNYNLTITAILQEQLHLKFSYNPDMYSEVGIERVIRHLQNIFTTIVQQPASQIATLEMLSPGEKQGILSQSAGPVLDYPNDQCVHNLIEMQNERNPDAIALIYDQQHLCYRQLNEEATKMAVRLRKMGIAQNSLVGVMLPRSLEMVISMLAILKAGGAYLPLDPNYPAERIRYMLTDSGAAGVIAVEEYQMLLPLDYPGFVMDLNSETWTDQSSRQCSGEAVSASMLPSDTLAYVIYTSGSTGQPKGIEIEHRSVVNFIESLQRLLPVTPGLRFLALTTISFDISVLELFFTLATGLTVVIAGSEAQRDPVTLNRLLCEEQIDFVQMTPSTLEMLIHSDFTARARLTGILLGGEPLLSPALNWLQTHTSARIFNLYGPTETTIWSTWKELTDDTQVLLGKPIHNTRVYILDHHQQLLPQGVIGELYIAGDGLARGYLRRPELTAERFLSDPYASGRMYRTGDLARWLPGGNLEFHGRADTQVKVRGFRVEIGEVETCLQTHAAIRTSAVVLRKDAGGDWVLVGYVLPEPSHETDLSGKALREFLAQMLPEYMIPSAFVLVDHMPLTPNGKVDRKALPDFAGESCCGEEVLSPRNEREAAIAAIWAEVLGYDQIGVYDNFFEIGGHSLKVTRVLARIQKVLKVQVSLQSFFANPTIAGLAEVLKQLEQKHVAQIPALPARPHYPVSHSQKRLWILDRFEENLAAYNMPSAYLLKGSLQREALQRALQTLVERHESLRTAFGIVQGEPVQVVAEQFTLPMGYTDLTVSGNEEVLNSKGLQQIVDLEADLPFDLTQPGQLRVHLYRLAEEAHLILLTMHHIISDEWSTHLLISEITRLYAAYTRGAGNPLSPLRIQYRDYAVWQGEYLQSAVMQEMEQFWAERLAGELPTLHLLSDFPRPQVRSFRGDFAEFGLERELVQKLIQLSRKEGVTLFMTLLGAFYTLLHRYTGDDDLIVGVPVAGRSDEDLEQLIGFFVNTLPLRLQLNGDERFSELLQKVKEVAVNGFANQEYPFDRLVDLLACKRDPGRSPIFDVMFNLINLNPAPELTDAAQPTYHSFEGSSFQTVEGLTFEPVRQKSKTSKLDLTLTLQVQGEEIRGGIEYCTDLFRPETIQRMVQHYENILHVIVTNDAKQVGEMELLTPEERELLQAGFAVSELEMKDVVGEQLWQAYRELNSESEVMEENVRDLRLFILDGRHQPVPFGVTGSIYFNKLTQSGFAAGGVQKSHLCGRILATRQLELIPESITEEVTSVAVDQLAPRTELETKIVQIWKEILGVEQVGIGDSFFTLGGNSLLIIQLYEQLQSIIAVPFSLANLFSYHTIGMFTDFLASLEDATRLDSAGDGSLSASSEPRAGSAAGMSSEKELADLFSQLASGELTPEKAAELFAGGREDD